LTVSLDQTASGYKDVDKTMRFSAYTRAAKTVVIGGGTGAPVSIRALLSLGAEVSAVVAMADDGGSSGLLREQLGIVPPGDIRKCLVSMASDADSLWVKAFTRRLSYINDHPLGNLMLATLGEISGSLPKAIELCEELLDARGRVYPSTLEAVELYGVTVTGERVEGQACMTASENAMLEVYLNPAAPEAYSQALQAILDADLIVLGPGSLYTSIIPNLLVPGLIDAVRNSSAIRLFLCSLADMQGETRGMSVFEHVDALLRHGMQGSLDIVVAHDPAAGAWSAGAGAMVVDSAVATAALTAALPATTPIRRVEIAEGDRELIEALGIELIVRDLVDPLRPTWHDVDVLAGLLHEVLCTHVFEYALPELPGQSVGAAKTARVGE